VKVKDKYLFYTITDISEEGSDVQEYELTIEINHKVKKQIRSSDQRYLRAYIWGYIEWMYLFRK